MKIRLCQMPAKIRKRCSCCGEGLDYIERNGGELLSSFEQKVWDLYLKGVSYTEIANLQIRRRRPWTMRLPGRNGNWSRCCPDKQGSCCGDQCCKNSRNAGGRRCPQDRACLKRTLIARSRTDFCNNFFLIKRGSFAVEPGIKSENSIF